MVKVFKDLSMVICIKEIIKMVSLIIMDSIIGKIKAILKEILKMG